MKATARGLPFMMSALEGEGGNGKVYKGKGGCMNVTVTRGCQNIRTSYMEGPKADKAGKLGRVPSFIGFAAVG